MALGILGVSEGVLRVKGCKGLQGMRVFAEGFGLRACSRVPGVGT